MVWRLRFWRVLHTHRLLVGTGGRCLCVIVVGGKEEGNVYFSRKFVHPRLDEKTHFPPVRANPRLDGSFKRKYLLLFVPFVFSLSGVSWNEKKKRTDGASNSTLGSGKVTRRMKCRPRPRLATFRLQNFSQSRIKLPL